MLAFTDTLHLEGLLPLDLDVYVHQVRDEHQSPICGACTGQKHFPVCHKDGEIRFLPCAICKGTGKLYTSKTCEVVDVHRAIVVGRRVDFGCMDGPYFAKTLQTQPPSLRVSYRVRVGTSQNVLVVSQLGGEPETPVPRNAWGKKVRLNQNLYWLKRAAAQAVADAYNLELRAAYAQSDK